MTGRPSTCTKCATIRNCTIYTGPPGLQKRCMSCYYFYLKWRCSWCGFRDKTGNDSRNYGPHPTITFCSACNDDFLATRPSRRRAQRIATRTDRFVPSTYPPALTAALADRGIVDPDSLPGHANNNSNENENENNDNGDNGDNASRANNTRSGDNHDTIDQRPAHVPVVTTGEGSPHRPASPNLNHPQQLLHPSSASLNPHPPPDHLPAADADTDANAAANAHLHASAVAAAAAAAAEAAAGMLRSGQQAFPDPRHSRQRDDADGVTDDRRAHHLALLDNTGTEVMNYEASHPSQHDQDHQQQQQQQQQSPLSSQLQLQAQQSHFHSASASASAPLRRPSADDPSDTPWRPEKRARLDRNPPPSPRRTRARAAAEAGADNSTNHNDHSNAANNNNNTNNNTNTITPTPLRRSARRAAAASAALAASSSSTPPTEFARVDDLPDQTGLSAAGPTRRRASAPGAQTLMQRSRQPQQAQDHNDKQQIQQAQPQLQQQLQRHDEIRQHHTKKQQGIHPMQGVAPGEANPISAATAAATAAALRKAQQLAPGGVTNPFGANMASLHPQLAPSLAAALAPALAPSLATFLAPSLAPLLAVALPKAVVDSQKQQQLQREEDDRQREEQHRADLTTMRDLLARTERLHAQADRDLSDLRAQLRAINSEADALRARVAVLERRGNSSGGSKGGNSSAIIAATEKGDGGGHMITPLATSGKAGSTVQGGGSVGKVRERDGTGAATNGAVQTVAEDRTGTEPQGCRDSKSDASDVIKTGKAHVFASGIAATVGTESTAVEGQQNELELQQLHSEMVSTGRDTMSHSTNAGTGGISGSGNDGGANYGVAATAMLIETGLHGLMDSGEGLPPAPVPPRRRLKHAVARAAAVAAAAAEAAVGGNSGGGATNANLGGMGSAPVVVRRRPTVDVDEGGTMGVHNSKSGSSDGGGGSGADARTNTGTSTVTGTDTRGAVGRGSEEEGKEGATVARPVPATGPDGRDDSGGSGRTPTGDANARAAGAGAKSEGAGDTGGTENEAQSGADDDDAAAAEAELNDEAQEPLPATKEGEVEEDADVQMVEGLGMDDEDDDEEDDEDYNDEDDDLVDDDEAAGNSTTRHEGRSGPGRGTEAGEASHAARKNDNPGNRETGRSSSHTGGDDDGGGTEGDAAASLLPAGGKSASSTGHDGQGGPASKENGAATASSQAGATVTATVTADKGHDRGGVVAVIEAVRAADEGDTSGRGGSGNDGRDGNGQVVDNDSVVQALMSSRSALESRDGNGQTDVA